jgi:hypothetical protein
VPVAACEQPKLPPYGCMKERRTPAFHSPGCRSRLHAGSAATLCAKVALENGASEMQTTVITPETDRRHQGGPHKGVTVAAVEYTVPGRLTRRCKASRPVQHPARPRHAQGSRVQRDRGKCTAWSIVTGSTHVGCASRPRPPAKGSCSPAASWCGTAAAAAGGSSCAPSVPGHQRDLVTGLQPCTCSHAHWPC